MRQGCVHVVIGMKTADYMGLQYPRNQLDGSSRHGLVVNILLLCEIPQMASDVP